MDFFLTNLKETLEAINKLMDSNITIVNTKRIRRCNNIKSSNHSKINFIWRGLKYLEDVGILKLNKSANTKSFKIKIDKKIVIEDILTQAEKDRKIN